MVRKKIHWTAQEQALIAMELAEIFIREASAREDYVFVKHAFQEAQAKALPPARRRKVLTICTGSPKDIWEVAEHIKSRTLKIHQKMHEHALFKAEFDIFRRGTKNGYAVPIRFN